MTIYPKLILDALATVRYPGTGKNIVEAGMVEDNIRIDGNKVSFSLIFEKPTDPFMKSVIKAAETAILTYVGPEVDIAGNISVKTIQQARPEVGKLLPQVKNVIAISSGKEVWASPRWRPIWLSHWPSWAIRSDCLTPTSSVLRCPRCFMWRMPALMQRALTGAT